MIKKWNEIDAFTKVSVVMVSLWVIGICTIVAGYEASGRVLIWLPFVVGVVAIIVRQIKKRE